MTEPVQTEVRQTSTEENVYSVVYYALLAGMIVSSILFAMGIIRALLSPGTFYPLTPEWVRQHYSVSWLTHGIVTLDPVALMMAGTVLLILTPVARVLVSIYAFLVDRDFKYVGITGIVFLIMAITVIAGLFGLK